MDNVYLILLKHGQCLFNIEHICNHDDFMCEHVCNHDDFMCEHVCNHDDFMCEHVCNHDDFISENVHIAGCHIDLNVMRDINFLSLL